MLVLWKKFIKKYSQPTSEAMLESALANIHSLEKLNFLIQK